MVRNETGRDSRQASAPRQQVYAGVEGEGQGVYTGKKNVYILQYTVP